MFFDELSMDWSLHVRLDQNTTAAGSIVLNANYNQLLIIIVINL